MYMTREEVLGRLRATLRKGQPIVGTGAGIGLAAHAEERGGADLIIVYGTGKYRMAGRSSMAGRFAFGNANDLVLKMAQEVMPVAPHTPVLAGVFIQDPFRDMMGFIEQLKQAGYSGVQNVPGMGGMDQMEGARTVTSLDAAGIGMAMELAFLRAAKDRRHGHDTIRIQPHAGRPAGCKRFGYVVPACWPHDKRPHGSPGGAADRAVRPDAQQLD